MKSTLIVHDGVKLVENVTSWSHVQKIDEGQAQSIGQ